jgi:hypothetical protein
MQKKEKNILRQLKTLKTLKAMQTNKSLRPQNRPRQPIVK